ncbi:hypothetical protein [Pseudanabaena sp. UWO310]|uniref:hypothetical protein n=1 Tax=Pseudanabaena sp. UWO310 TaxID=2480795 RepID=UPI00115773CA|nr:hypothetical protein [Pseudanabaena sp. UWO310]TYQ25608.1 hypothetical protein PseudUWO310_18755 [Pseudanabaena sp. UWO310]
MKRTLISSIIITTLFLFSNAVSAQTDRNFEALLSAYQKALVQYDLAQHLSDYSEQIYWGEQYHFYKQKLWKIISAYDQAARDNPKKYCLSALDIYYRFDRVDKSVFMYNELPALNDSSSLQKYCSRFDIYYEPNQRM